MHAFKLQCGPRRLHGGSPPYIRTHAQPMLFVAILIGVAILVHDCMASASASKRQRRLECLAGTDISCQKFEEILEKLGCDEPTRVRDDLTEYLDIKTPLGPLISQLQVPLESGKSFSWHCANPAPLLYTLCDRSPNFAQLLQDSHHAGPGGVVLYTDDCTPGNQFRPDSARTTLCVYWTLRDLPAWFRSRMHGWNSFGFMKAAKVHQVLGGLSALMVLVLQQFFSGLLNLLQGVRLPGLGKTLFLFRASLCCLVQDEKAHKEVFDVKGASGTKFCLNCSSALL